MSGPTWQRDVDEDTGETGYSRSWERGGYEETEFSGSHGSHWTEETYPDGSVYRVDDDGTVTKQ